MFALHYFFSGGVQASDGMLLTQSYGWGALYPGFRPGGVSLGLVLCPVILRNDSERHKVNRSWPLWRYGSMDKRWNVSV